MSKKNLSRTVIEGGRYTGNKWDRRNSHAEERAQLRNYLKEIEHDPENYDEYDVEPLQPVHKGFKDKLSPMYRWLQSKVGRPWDEVRSEVTKEFDTRTVAGRHIVYDHLLSSVQLNKEEYRYYWRGSYDETTSYSDHDYYVDEEGLLQKKRYLGRRTVRGYEKIPPFDTKQIANWLSGRVVGQVGNKFFWFVPTGKAQKHKGMGQAKTWRIAWGSRRGYYYDNGLRFEYLAEEITYKKDSLGKVMCQDGKPIEMGRKTVWWPGHTPSLRQDRKLNEKEMEFWSKLPAYYRTKVLELSPNYPNPPKENYYGSYYRY